MGDGGMTELQDGYALRVMGYTLRVMGPVRELQEVT